uniref:Nibrin n=1 Tax=Strigamia maritima TaxID=126957 RepID=T1J527_STRMM
MWTLQNLIYPVFFKGIVYHLVSGKEYIVGRKDCQINIENDKSISRKHAVLTVIHQESNVCRPENLPILQVEDLSKFGTSVNSDPVNKAQILKNGDEIKFGGLNSKYKVNYQALVVTTSCLKNGADKKLIKNCLAQLGGHFISDWQIGNTHLVMSSFVLTIKAVCALLSGEPIVRPQYLEALLKSVQNGDEKPKIKDFLPDFGEAALSGQNINIAPSEIRSKIFIGKTFLFSSVKQLSKLELPIKLGGGESVLITSSPTAGYLSRPGVCVINPSEPTTQSSGSWIQSADKTLKKYNRRMIPESEIGLAAVYCSTEKYCNPDFQIVPESLSMTPQTQIMDTQESYGKIKIDLSSVQVMNDEEEDDEENMEIETITLESLSTKSQEIDSSFANSNWTPTERPNLELTRKPDSTTDHEVNNNFTIIEFKSLVILPRSLYRSESRLDAGENFKNFKKALPLKPRSTNIPRTEMEMYQNPDHDMTIDPKLLLWFNVARARGNDQWLPMWRVKNEKTPSAAMTEKGKRIGCRATNAQALQENAAMKNQTP